MPIRERTIKENSKPAVPVEGSQTLTEAIQTLKDLKYSEDDTYLVVTLPGNEYKVILFSGITGILKKLGPSGLNQPLSNLPIPPAGRVVPTDTEEGGGEIINWVASHPEAPVVVTDAGKFAALFVNPNRSGGLADNLSLLEIHGEYVSINKDPRADSGRNKDLPVCPHCHQANYFKANDTMDLICPNCKEMV